MAKELIPREMIERKILLIRGHKVMLDKDLAELYGASTKRLNEQVKRNKKRFPEDFMFQLTLDEKNELVANCDRFRPLKHSTALPYALTGHGALMLANVIKSAAAIEVSILVVRAFARLREIIRTHKDLQRKIEDMEKKYDGQFQVVFQAIKKLMEPPPEKPKRRIGFHHD
ncbi:MAG: ORF6N domain-containing protein [Candidatus Omnitrophota bacterium]|jgi:hypothetical protein